MTEQEMNAALDRIAAKLAVVQQKADDGFAAINASLDRLEAKLLAPGGIR